MHATSRTLGALLALVTALTLPALGQALERPFSLTDLLGADLDGPTRGTLQTRLQWDSGSQSLQLAQAISLATATDWGPVQLTVGRLFTAGQVQPFFGVRLGEEGRRLRLNWYPTGWSGSLSWQLGPHLSLRVQVLATGTAVQTARPWLCLHDC